VIVSIFFSGAENYLNENNFESVQILEKRFPQLTVDKIKRYNLRHLEKFVQGTKDLTEKDILVPT
jgi:hypothetical protein